MLYSQTKVSIEYGFFAVDSKHEGLVLQIDWTNKASILVVSIGDEVDVMVLEIDIDKRRVSLGMKQSENPWLTFLKIIVSEILLKVR